MQLKDNYICVSGRKMPKCFVFRVFSLNFGWVIRCFVKYKKRKRICLNTMDDRVCKESPLRLCIYKQNKATMKLNPKT